MNRYGFGKIILMALAALIVVVAFMLLLTACQPAAPLVKPSAAKSAQASETAVNSKSASTTASAEPESTASAAPSASPGDIWSKNMPAGIPKPQATRFEKVDAKSVSCYGVTPDKFAAYQAVLTQNGFLMIEKNVDLYVYRKGGIVIQITDYSGTYSYTENDFIMVNASESVNTKYYFTGAISEEEALKIINSKLQKDGNTATDAVEQNVPDVYEKMKLQIFEAYGQKKDYGTFYIYGNQAFKESIPFTNTVVADIDSDGRYELLTYFEMGSGLDIRVLNAYGLGDEGKLVLKYNTSWVMDNQHAMNFYFEKADGSRAKLMGKEGYFGDPEKTYDFGYIQVKGKTLTMTNEKDIPKMKMGKN